MPGPRFTSPNRIDRGTRLSPDMLRQVADAVVRRISVIGGRARRIGQSVAIQIDSTAGQVAPLLPFPARITGSTATLADKIWDYDFVEVTVTSSGLITTPGGRTGTAINLVEQAHTAGSSIVFGVDTAGADYPAGFSAQAIADNTIVMMTQTVDETGLSRYIFALQGVHDGTCAAP